MKELNFIRFSYIGIFVAIQFIKVPNELNLVYDYGETDMSSYARLNLLINLVGLAITVAAHIYLLNMGIEMQKLFRQYGHITGFKGEYLMTVTYFFVICMLVYRMIFIPSILLNINTSSY